MKVEHVIDLIKEKAKDVKDVYISTEKEKSKEAYLGFSKKEESKKQVTKISVTIEENIT